MPDVKYAILVILSSLSPALLALAIGYIRKLRQETPQRIHELELRVTSLHKRSTAKRKKMWQRIRAIETELALIRAQLRRKGESDRRGGAGGKGRA